MAAKPKLQTKILEIVIRSINGYYKTSLRKKYGLKSLKLGAVTLIQRFGSSLNLNIHLHILFVDGGYEINGEKKVFYKLPSPTNDDIKELVEKISMRVIRYLRRKGYLDGAYDDTLQFDSPGFASMLAASVRNVVAFGPNKMNRLRRLIAPGWGFEGDSSKLTSKLCAAVNGFSLHGATAIKSFQRKRLEGLCKYVLRPPIAEERLTLLPNGDVSYRLKKRWTDGTSHIIYTQLEFMEKLAALVPPPRAHQVRFYGFLAPNSKCRSKLATSRRALKEKEENREDKNLNKAGKMRWARLLKRTFGIDVNVCRLCGGKTKILSAIHDSASIKRILNHAGIDPKPPPIKPATQMVMGL